MICRVLKLPRVGQFGDFGIIAPLGMVDEASEVPTEFNEPKKAKSEPGAKSSPSASPFPSRLEIRTKIAGLPVAAGRKSKLVEPVTEMSRAGSAAAASIQKLVGGTCFAWAAAMSCS